MEQIRLEPSSTYDSAIIGEEDGCLVYDVSKLLDILCAEFSLYAEPSEVEHLAIEYYCYNMESLTHMVGGPIYKEYTDQPEPTSVLTGLETTKSNPDI